jgi:hypothetical protein
MGKDEVFESVLIAKRRIYMFNYNFSFLKIKSHNENNQKLPPDFGSMYFLYPPETVDFFKFKPVGIMDKILSAVRWKFKKSDLDLEYYKQYGV